MANRQLGRTAGDRGVGADEGNILMGREGAIGHIQIHRPARFNALDVATARDLRKAGIAMARDPDVRVVLVRGLPGMFCSGVDLKYIRDGGDRAELGYLHPAARDVPGGFGEVFKQILEYLHSTIVEIRTAPKPFVAVVDGVAAAGGLGLAIACDLVIASSRASFEYAYFKTALTGAESTTFLLPKILGLRGALDLALLGKRLSATEARDLGLVSEVHEEDVFEAEVLGLARRLAEGPTRSIGEAKRLMNESLGMGRLGQHLGREAEALVAVADGDDFAEGLAAFFEKRPPRFRGQG